MFEARIGRIQVEDLRARAAATSKKTASPKKASPTKKKMAPSPKKAAKKSALGTRRAGAPATMPEFSSDYRTEAKGPNPALVAGPNLDNLIDDYVKEMGPNTEIRKGPDKTNATGPSETTGRDPQLTSGPDPANLTGPEPGLAKGSMYNSLRQC